MEHNTYMVRSDNFVPWHCSRVLELHLGTYKYHRKIASNTAKREQGFFCPKFTNIHPQNEYMQNGESIPRYLYRLTCRVALPAYRNVVNPPSVSKTFSGLPRSGISTKHCTFSLYRYYPCYIKFPTLRQEYRSLAANGFPCFLHHDIIRRMKCVPQNFKRKLDDLDYEIHQEQWEKARTRLAYLQEMCPEDVDVLHHKAVIATHDDQWDDAKALWEQVLRLHPDHIPALIGMARVALHQSDWAIANYYLRQAIVDDGRYQADARQTLMVVLARQAQDYIAQSEWASLKFVAQELLGLDSNHPIALNGLGMAAISETPLKEAEDYFRKALQYTDSAHGAFRAQILFNLGDVLYRQQSYEEALSWLEQAYQVHPDDVTARNGVINGWTQVLEGALRRTDWDRVRQATDRLLTMLPNDPIALNAMGLWHWHARHDRRRAFDAFQQAYNNTSSPRATSLNRASYAINAGQIALVRGQTFNARRWFLNALALQPHSASARSGIRAACKQLEATIMFVCITCLFAASVIFHW